MATISVPPINIGEITARQRKRWKKIFSKNSACVIGVFSDDKLIAVGAYDINKIYFIYVHPIFQRKKVGTRLMNQIFAEAKKMGSKKLSLFVNWTNIIACNFYKSVGGKQDNNLYDNINLDKLIYHWYF
jgi:ribosomal protein S18 acetylase RimI-like enzyme